MQEAKEGAASIRSCNRHADCDKFDAEYKARYKTEFVPFNQHSTVKIARIALDNKETIHDLAPNVAEEPTALHRQVAIAKENGIRWLQVSVKDLESLLSAPSAERLGDLKFRDFNKGDVSLCSECEGRHFYIHEGQGFVDICCVDCRAAIRYILLEGEKR